MDIKNERMIAYCLAVILFVVGVICYTAFAKKAPEQPIRIMFKNTGGNVLFDHKIHLAESGYGLDCTDCHHDLEKEGARPAPCGECHLTDGSDAPKRADAFHKQCRTCHEDGGGPTTCSACHAL